MRIFLAPMEGVVDHHIRYLLTEIGGIDLCVTEFIRVTDHLLPKKVFYRYCPELATNTSDDFYSALNPVAKNAKCPTRIQLLGSNPEALAENAHRAATLGAPGIDLNFGCPAKTVNKNRGGACLLDHTELLHSIVSAVRAAVPKHIPVTAKIRLGYMEKDSYKDNAVAISEAGASELVVHARSKSDGYKPPAYWNCIAELRDLITIPVVANGEIWSLENYKRCRELSQCEDFMLGRGLLARPDLALAIRAYQRQIDYKPMKWQEIATYLHKFFLLTCDAYPKKYMGNRVKQWLHYLQLQYPQAKTLFSSIKRVKDKTTLDRALTQYCTPNM